ncbi:ADAMTS-like protein 5 [Trichonephila clavipes]|nr:ADAMTS-like protein 5 [Trichonephila clavipes]
MSFPEHLIHQWTILCFLGFFSEYMLVWSRDTTEIDRYSVRARYYSRIWSDWTPWSVCSRTCGGGVRQRTRVCKTRMVGYRVSDTCLGDTIEYELCSRHLSKTPKETYAMLVRVYDDQALSMKCEYLWFARVRKAGKVFLINPVAEDW